MFFKKKIYDIHRSILRGIRNATLISEFITFTFNKICKQTKFIWKVNQLPTHSTCWIWNDFLNSFIKIGLSNPTLNKKVTGILAAHYLHKNRHGLISNWWQPDRSFSESYQVSWKKIYGHWFHSKSSAGLKSTTVFGVLHIVRVPPVVFNRRQKEIFGDHC